MKLFIWLGLGFITLVLVVLLWVLDNVDKQSQIKLDAASSQTLAKPQKPKPTIKGLLEETNRVRAARGVHPLKLDPQLNQSAKLKLDDMVANNYFAHANPTTGKEGNTYITDLAGWSKCPAGTENLQMNFKSVSNSEIIGGWMKSKQGHAEAIVDHRYDLVGFAFNDKYVVQHFCDLQW